MLNTDQLKQLKRTNISKNPEKTKQRIKELWQGLKIKEKQDLRAMADITPQPIYRAEEIGTISARLVLAFAQSLNVNPFYLTGEVNEPGECGDELIRDLLLQCGYQALVAEIEKPMKRAYTRRQLPEDAPVDNAVSEAPTEELALPLEPVSQLSPSNDSLTTEELQQLVYALTIQAKADIISAKEKLNRIKLVIFS